jgi:hypothetical protein
MVWKEHSYVSEGRTASALTVEWCSYLSDYWTSIEHSRKVLLAPRKREISLA